MSVFITSGNSREISKVKKTDHLWSASTNSQYADLQLAVLSDDVDPLAFRRRFSSALPTFVNYVQSFRTRVFLYHPALSKLVLYRVPDSGYSHLFDR